MDNSNRIITSNMFLPNIAQVFEFFFVPNLHFLIRLLQSIYYVFRFGTVYFRCFRGNLATTDINEANILLYKV